MPGPFIKGLIVTEHAIENTPKPISIPEDIAARYTAPDQFEKFDATVRKVLSVPRSVFVQCEAEYQRQVALNPKRRGPKPKLKPPVA